VNSEIKLSRVGAPEPAGAVSQAAVALEDEGVGEAGHVVCEAVRVADE
jgi:hypothetical protein